MIKYTYHNLQQGEHANERENLKGSNKMDIKKVISNFERNRYQVSYFETAEEATDYLNHELYNTLRD